ncbi:Transglutaminase-like superfamily-domain-containing protein [Cladochytrium replicatum]|nr:Transglutaminase-like superfamily-domain-containing protein [Cladochytrium replicatum]
MPSECPESPPAAHPGCPCRSFVLMRLPSVCMCETTLWLALGGWTVMETSIPGWPNSNVLTSHDLILLIIRHLDAVTIARFRRISRTWRDSCMVSSLWKSHTLQRWANHSALPQTSDAATWLKYYGYRHTIDRECYALFKCVLSERGQRIERCLQIADHGANAVDFLVWIKSPNREPSTLLSRQWHVDRIRGIIGRQRVVREWKSFMAAVSSGEPSTFSLEYGAFLLSHAMDKDIEFERDVNSVLHELAEKFSRTEDLPESGTKFRIKALCEYMFRKNGYGPPMTYYSVANSQIDRVLQDKEGLPLMLSLVLHAVGRRVGLQIDIIGFPGHVLSSFIDEDGKRWYIDTFNPDSFQSERDCQQSLHNLRHVGFANNLSILQPLSDRGVYIRCANNLVLASTSGSALHAGGGTLIECMYCSFLSLLCISGPDDTFSTILMRVSNIISQDQPEDVWFLDVLLQRLNRHELAEMGRLRTLLETVAVKIRNEDRGPAGVMDAQDEDVLARAERRRNSSDTIAVRFRIGEVVRNIRENYSAVVVGWDPVCDMDLRRTNVFPRGRNQPFYHVRRSNRQTSHYVAEDLLELDPNGSLYIGAWLGRFFDAWNEDTSRFIPNRDVRSVYPND